MIIIQNPEEILVMETLVISYLHTMTFKHYLQQPKSMLELTLLTKEVNNPEFKKYSNLLKFINSFDNVQEAFQTRQLSNFLFKGCIQFLGNLLIKLLSLLIIAFIFNSTAGMLCFK